MAEAEIACACGESITVQEWDAGLDRTCPQCGSSIAVPTIERIKELAGDKHPMMSHWQKLIHAVDYAESPFDGTCHGCGKQRADFAVPMELSILDERQVADEAPITISPLFVSINVPEAVEEWQTVVFPLCLCDSCYRQFQSSFRWRSIARGVLLVVFSVASLLLFLVALPCGIFALILVFFVLSQSVNRKKGDMRFAPWLSKLPIVADILQQEAEYRLQKGPAVEIPASAEERPVDGFLDGSGGFE